MMFLEEKQKNKKTRYKPTTKNKNVLLISWNLNVVEYDL